VEFLVPESTNFKHIIGINFNLNKKRLFTELLFDTPETIPKEKLKVDISKYIKALQKVVCNKFGIKPKETLFIILIN